MSGVSHVPSFILEYIHHVCNPVAPGLISRSRRHPTYNLPPQGYNSVGLAVKHRQLARQVGVLFEDPPVNSMASFNFTRAMLDEGTMFTFGS
jgi:hypothetical protein